MQQIVFKDVSITYGSKQVINSANFGITTGMKVGLIGENGSGKTTILRLITGEEAPEHGTVTLVGANTLWHVNQIPDECSGTCAWDTALAARPTLAKLAGRMKQLETQLETGDPPEDQAIEYAEVLAAYSDSGGYAFEQQITLALTGLGLAEQQFNQPLSELSGGERARVFLAQALLAEPDLLLLDEPDNHLDIPGLKWMEQTLLAYQGTLVLATHDRELLTKVVDATLEIEDGNVRMEHGSLDDYMLRKRERIERTRLEFFEQQRRVKKLTADIRQVEQKAQKYEDISTNDFQRRKAKGVAKTAVVRKAKLEKELAGENLLKLPAERKQISVRIDGNSKGANHLLQLDDIGFSFAKRTLFNSVSLELQRGERLALTGANGCGKTTLLRIALGQLIPDSGTVFRAQNADVFYCDQKHAGLDPKLSAYDQLLRDTELSPNQVYYLLARMQLKGDAAHRSIATLSGGERTRLVLVLLMNAKASLLILDEPTNHLDLPSMEILEDALVGFSGAVLFSSHDRRLVKHVATGVFEMRNGGLHPG